MAVSKLFLALFLVFVVLTLEEANGAATGKTKKLIDMANRRGPYLGLVIPNLFEMNPLLQHPSYKPTNLTIDYAGRRFRFGYIDNQPVVLVMTGLAMLNAGITTQLLLALFKVKGVVHYGIAGNANPSLHIGDVAIPQYWAHTALWNWQKYGDGPQNELPLEVNGDYTRDIGYLKISKYSVNVTNCNSHNNLLNNVWYQPEEVFPVFGTPEERQHIFWVPVDPQYFAIAEKLKEKIELELSQSTVDESEILPNDAVGKVLGKEHSGRVRCLGLGAVPGRDFRQTRHRYSDLNASSYNNGSCSSQWQEKYNQMLNAHNQIQENYREMMNAFKAYMIMKEGRIPEEFAGIFVSPPHSTSSDAAS